MVQLRRCLAMAACLALVAGCDAGRLAREAKMNKALEELGATPRVFVNDGASDYTVSMLEPPSVRDLLDRDGIHLLLARLDDTSPTMTVIRDRGEEAMVPLGYLCLDLLLQMSADGSLVFDQRDIGDDGAWTNVLQPFFFPANVLSGGQGPEIMREVRAGWEEAFRLGRLRFKDEYQQSVE